MKVMICRPDNTVAVDGVAYWVNCAALAAYIKVIQWDRDRGHIEFVNDGRGVFNPNIPLVDIAPYQFLIDAWRAADTIAKEKAATDKAARDDEGSAAAALRGES